LVSLTRLIFVRLILGFFFKSPNISYKLQFGSQRISSIQISIVWFLEKVVSVWKYRTGAPNLYASLVRTNH